MYDLAVHELAVRALASGGHGGHGGRRIIILVLLLIIVAVIVGWVLYARRNRGRS
jgi:uncharacterized iron-regulated membrane protein